MKEDRTLEEKYTRWVRAVNICHAKGWMVFAGWVFQSPSGTFHDLSCADFDKLDSIERNRHFISANT